MARLYSNKARSYDMGVLPTELPARDPQARSPISALLEPLFSGWPEMNARGMLALPAGPGHGLERTSSSSVS